MIFQDRGGFFFIECGAFDGEGRSNTLTLERDHGWEGLLVEADPTSIDTLRYVRTYLVPIAKVDLTYGLARPLLT